MERASVLGKTHHCERYHRLLLLKLDKQIGGTIYWPILRMHSTWRWGVPYWRGWVQFKCLVGCRLPPLDGYLAVCLFLTIDVDDATLVQLGKVCTQHT